MRFTGYAAVFDKDSEPLPFVERIMPGAFNKSLRSRNEVKMFMNHNMDMVLASTRSKTLKLKEDSQGLLAEAILPDTTAGRDLAVLMKRGDVHSMSFGFSVPKDGDSWSKDGRKRELNEIRLHEVSVVTGFPAYKDTTATIRTIDYLATRTNVDPDKLSDAITALENGDVLNEDSANLIVEVVNKLKEHKPTTEDLSYDEDCDWVNSEEYSRRSYQYGEILNFKEINIEEFDLNKDISLTSGDPYINEYLLSLMTELIVQ
jgi:HK97 family phage prohead protease